MLKKQLTKALIKYLKDSKKDYEKKGLIATIDLLIEDLELELNPCDSCDKADCQCDNLYQEEMENDLSDKDCDNLETDQY